VLDAWDLVEITSIWLLAAGVNGILGLREKRLDGQISRDEEGDISK